MRYDLQCAELPGTRLFRLAILQSTSIDSKGSHLRKSPARVVSRLTMTAARVNLGQLAKRVHLNSEYFILEKDGIPIIGIMGADELEDYLELRDPKVKARIEKSNLDVKAGRVRPASSLLEELKSK